MTRVFLASTDVFFSEKIAHVLPTDVEFLYNSSQEDRINKTLAGDADIVIIDYDSIHHLKDSLPKAKVIVASNQYDLEKEYVSALLGAKGFITKDLDSQAYIKAIDVVNSGYIWMTRTVATMVFNEYSKMLRM